MSMRPIVFLDMDDVLCVSERYNSVQMMMCIREQRMEWPELWLHLVDASAASNLRSLHEQFFPRYVVSSSWATYLGRSQMCDVFARTSLGFVSEHLHDSWVTPRAGTTGRLEEIERWLDEFCTDGLPFVVLDDSLSGWSLADSWLDFEGRVVLCEPGRGFTQGKLEVAIALLCRQLSDGHGPSHV